MTAKITYVYWVTKNGKRVDERKIIYYENDPIRVEEEIKDFFKRTKKYTSYIMREEVKNYGKSSS